MADDVVLLNTGGTPAPLNVVTDEETATGKHLQVVKLAISADGVRTLVPATVADGMLVNLGTNNDVTIADGLHVAIGATTDAAVITDTTGTAIGRLRGLVKWAFERMPASLGQKTMAASLPVVFASDQSPLTVAVRARTTDSISAAPQRIVVMDGLTERTVTVVNTAVAAAQTDSVLVAAQGAGVKIAVRWFLISNQSAASATSAQFNTKPAGAGTKKQSFQIPASDVRGAGSNDDGWIVTAANEGLTLTTGGQGVDISFAWFPTT